MEVVYETAEGQQVPSEELERELSKESLPSFRDNDSFVKVKRYYSTDQVKRNERAERWGVEVKVVQEKVGDEMEEERDEMELDMHEMAVMAVGEGNIRDTVLHVHGTDDMSTADVFRYFGSFLPTYLEWIDDSSCNAVFNEPESAKAALYGLTEPLVGVTGTPFAQYRKGRDWKENHPILMRYAYTSDKKEVKKRKRSRYYELYGVPGAEREPPKSHKRRRMEEKRKVVVATDHRPKMRMDEEEGADITVLIENDMYANQMREAAEQDNAEEQPGDGRPEKVILSSDMFPPAPRKGSVAPPPTPVGPAPPNLFAEGAQSVTPSEADLSVLTEVNVDEEDEEDMQD